MKLGLLLLFFLAFSGASFAQAYGISISTDKFVYSGGGAVHFSGRVYLVNGSFPVSSGNVSISIENASLSNVSTDVVLPVSSGYFNSTISAPSSPGSYLVRAKYADSGGTIWQSAVSFRVTDVLIDSILLRPNRAGYHPGELVSLVIEPVVELSTGYASVADVVVYGSLRQSNGTIIRSFGACSETGSNRTGSAGTCTVSFSAPSQPGTYVLEANDFVSTNSIVVMPFEAIVSIKDGTGTYPQSLFSGDQAGRVVVSVTYNRSLPSEGSYYFSGNVSYSNGSVAMSIPQTDIDNSTYSGYYPFTTGGLPTGTYSVRLAVVGAGSSFSVVSSAFFEVRTWSLFVDKLSGFVSAYNAFPGSNVSFSISAVDVSTGAGIPFDMNTTNVSLFNRVGTLLANPVPVWNSTLNASTVSFAAPSSTGTYTLSVIASYGGSSRAVERVFKVVDVSASAFSADSGMQPKDLFGGSEPVYVLLSASNSEGPVTITDAQIADVFDDGGNRLNYTNVSWAVDSNLTAEWRVNVSNSTAFFKIDNPRRGGAYSLKLYANERSAVASARFVVDPYKIAASPKGENDDSSWGGRRQFSTRDKVLFTVYVYDANHKSGTSRMAFEETYGSGMISAYGMNGSAGGTKSSAGNAVVNATVVFEQVANDMVAQPLPVSAFNASCMNTDNAGRAECTLVPKGGKWDGGWYRVSFRVTGSDGVTSGVGQSSFEARSFYISGYTYDQSRSSSGYSWGDGKWLHKPSDNVSIRAYLFDAGNSGWWGYYMGSGSGSASAGLSGTISVEKILYRGSQGAWLWTPVVVSPSDYVVSGTGIVSGGQGNLSITPALTWRAGSYTAILRGTKTSGNDSETDYGQVWFEVRQWDAWASPVDASAAYDRWKSSFSVRENVTLYVNIRNAGTWNYNPENLAGGATLAVGVKKIEDFSSWPPREMGAGDYEVTPIAVSKSSPDMWNYGQPVNSSYVLKIVPTSGRWGAGYYNVVLDINGTETGYGWFNVIAFYANARFVDASGRQIYTSQGGSTIYFNVTTTRTPYYGWGEPSGLINATVKEVRLRGSSGMNTDAYSSIPGGLNNDFDVVPALVNGQGIVTFNKTGQWADGWYNGEIVFRDSENSTSTAWVYFQIKSFEVSAYASSWEIPAGRPVNVSLRVLRDWSDSSFFAGNYTVDSVSEVVWNYGGSLETKLTNYAPGNETEFNGQTSLMINPNGGSWSPGYHSLTIKVRNNESKSGTAWVSFNVVPFTADIVNQKWTYRATENVSVNLTIRESASSSTPYYANVSTVIEKDWSVSPVRETVLNFSVNSTGGSGKKVNGTGVLTIVPPAGGWSQNYHTIDVKFVDSSSGSSPVMRTVSFDVRSYEAWVYPANLSSGWYNYNFGKNENVTMKLTVFLAGTGTGAAVVNVTQAEYLRTAASSQYSGATYSVACTSGAFNDSTPNITPCKSPYELNSTAFVILSPPPGGWAEGDYDARITFSGSEGAAKLNAGFHVADNTPVGISLLSPAPGALITELPLFLFASTTKVASCDYQTSAMYWRNYVSYMQTNHSVYVHSNNLPSNGNNTITVYCRDSSGRESSAGVTVYLNVSSRIAPRMNLTVPYDGQTNVSTTYLTLYFTKKMSTIYVELKSALGTAYEYLFSYNNTYFVYNPSPRLAANTTYDLTILYAWDTDGNSLEGARSITFTTGLPAYNDTTPPAIVSRWPSPGDVNVSVAAVLNVTFNETVNQATFSFLLLDVNTSTYVGGNGVWVTQSTFRFTPAYALSYGHAYAMFIYAYDLYGNQFAEYAGVPFRTVVGTEGPESQELLSNGGFESGAAGWIVLTNGSLPSSGRTRLDSFGVKLLNSTLHGSMNLTGQNSHVFDAPGRGPETLPTLSGGAVFGNATSPAKQVNYSERILINNTGTMSTSFAAGRTIVSNSDGTNGYSSSVLEMGYPWLINYGLNFDEPVNVSTLVHQNLTFLGKRYLVAAGSTKYDLVLAANGTPALLQLGESAVFAGKAVNLTYIYINGSEKVGYFAVSDANGTTVYRGIWEGHSDKINGIDVSVKSINAQNASLVFAANTFHLTMYGYYPAGTTDYLVTIDSSLQQPDVISGISLKHVIQYTGANSFASNEERSFLEGLVSLKYLGLQEVPAGNIRVTTYPTWLGDYDGTTKQAIEIRFPQNVVTRQNANLNYTDKVYLALTQVTLGGTTYDNGTLFYLNSSSIPPFYEPLNISTPNYASFNLGSGRVLVLNATRDPTPSLSIHEPTNGAYAHYGKWIFTFTEDISPTGAPKINSLNFTATRPGAPVSLLQGGLDGHLTPVAWTRSDNAFVFRSGYTSPYGTAVSSADTSQVVLSLPVEERLAQLGIGVPGNFLSMRSSSDLGIILNQNISRSNVSSKWYNFSVSLRRDVSSPGPDGHALNFYVGYRDNESVLRNYSLFTLPEPNVTVFDSFVEFRSSFQMPASAAALTSFFVEKVGSGLFWIDNVSLRAAAGSSNGSSDSQPQVVILSPGNGAGVLSPVMVWYNVSGNFSKVLNVSYRLDGAGDVFVPKTLPLANFSVSASAGLHSLFVFLWNLSGVVSSAPVNFTVNGSDTVPPNVSWTLPADLSTGVSVYSNFTVNFTEAMNASSVKFDFAPFVTGSVVNLTNSSFRFFPQSPLVQNTMYLVNVSGRDLAGNALNPYYFGFTTESVFLPQELLTNTGFEQLFAGYPVNWTILTNQSYQENRTRLDNITQFAGLNSIYSNWDYGPVLSQNLTSGAAGNFVLNLSVYLRQFGIANNSLQFFLSYINASSQPQDVLFMQPNVSGTFTRFEASVTLPSTALNLSQFYVSKVGISEFWLDNVSLRRVG